MHIGKPVRVFTNANGHLGMAGFKGIFSLYICAPFGFSTSMYYMDRKNTYMFLNSISPSLMDRTSISDYFIQKPTTSCWDFYTFPASPEPSTPARHCCWSCSRQAAVGCHFSAQKPWAPGEAPEGNTELSSAATRGP